jgi:hypothetical protein
VKSKKLPSERAVTLSLITFHCFLAADQGGSKRIRQRHKNSIYRDIQDKQDESQQAKPQGFMVLKPKKPV